MADLLTLRIDGTDYGGWKTVTVTRSIENIAGTFEVTVSERWPGNPVARAIRPGNFCEVLVDDDFVITGYVDNVEPSYDAGSHEVTISGRDVTGDLVDSSAIHQPGSWQDRTLTQIAAALVKPFDVSIRTDVDVGAPFRRFALQPGETVFEAIERMCRQRAILPISDGQGQLIFTRAGTARRPTALVFGKNVLAAGGYFSDRDRHSEYIVRGQQPIEDGWNVEATTEPEARATDPAVKRYRPLLVLAEEPGDGVTFADRAKWEASVRAGRARRASYAVQGWRDGAGELWPINAIVEVEDTELGIQRDMLIAGATMRLDEGGSRTELSVARPEAFDLIALADTEEEGLWTFDPSAG